MQDEDPVAGAYKPGLHLLHLGCPVFWVISTTQQGVLGATEVLENVPAAQPVTRNWWMLPSQEPTSMVVGTGCTEMRLQATFEQ